jgi:hypothetical protein
MGIKTIIITVVILLGVGGGVYYFIGKDSGDLENQNQTSQSLGGSKSISDLLGSGQNVRCTYSYTDEQGYTSTGNAFIAGDKLRGSFSVQNAKGTQNSNVLRDDNYQYVWQDGSNSGFKTKISALQSDDTEKSTDKQQLPVDQDTKYDFDCSKWNVDQSVFKAPGNVNFSDYSKQLEQSQQLQDSVRDQQEAACRNLAGEARDACESAL